MRKRGTPIIIRRDQEKSEIAKKSQPQEGQQAKRIKTESISHMIRESRRCEIFTISIHLKAGAGRRVKIFKDKLKDQCFKEDDILEKAIISSFKIYEDSIFKPDTGGNIF